MHTDPTLMVFTELYCLCGALWRQRDPVAVVAPIVAEFVARHTGRGHGQASKADCIRARETRREARYVAVGKQHLFRAKTYEHVDTTDVEVRPRPPLPEPPPEPLEPVDPDGAAVPRFTDRQED